jgi:hypothetical protein
MTRTILCPRCVALRWIEHWHESSPETLAIGLGPCGHVVERTARLEWRVPAATRAPAARVDAGRAR